MQMLVQHKHVQPPSCKSETKIYLKKRKKRQNKSSQTLLSAGGNNGNNRKERNCISLETQTILGESVGGLPCFCRGFHCGMSTMPCPTHWGTRGNTGEHGNSCIVFAPLPFSFITFSTPGILLLRTFSLGFHLSAKILRELSGYNGKTMWCAPIDLSSCKYQKPQHTAGN